jgi:hypothetical protein
MGCVVSITPRPLLLPGKEPVPTVQEAGWAPGPVWTGEGNLAPSGFDARTFQPVASRYTDWATPDHHEIWNVTIFRKPAEKIQNSLIIISSYWPSDTPIFIVLTYYMGNMFRLIIKSSSGRYIQIQILGYCVMGSHILTYCVWSYIMIN